MLESLYRNVTKRAQRTALPTGEPKLLVCHDYAGGYHEDAEVEGTFSSESANVKYPLYAFLHWHVTDLYVYFSHERVTIPPVSWINAAHRNGVKILGTFITEWEAGITENEALLQQDCHGNFIFADKLVDIAVICGFDGWFFNFESVFPSDDDIPRLVKFLKYITYLSHSRIPDSEIIMYDSITVDNKISWQDCLNERNRVFFDACDGLFSNYTWTLNKLNESAINGRQVSRPTDVYTGNDVWGRNTYGGGEFQTSKGLEAINAHGTSIAIFAQAWTYEKFGCERFLKHDYRLWYSESEGLSWHLRERALDTDSFYSDFDRGFGKLIAENGKIKFKGLWHNISLQSILPNMQYSRLFKSWATGHYDDRNRFSWEPTDEIAWNGGTSLKISSNYFDDSANEMWTSHLFLCHIQTKKHRISVTYLKTHGASILFRLTSQDVSRDLDKILVPCFIIHDAMGNVYLEMKLDFYEAWHTTSVIIEQAFCVQEILLAFRSANNHCLGYIGEISIQPHGND